MRRHRSGEVIIVIGSSKNASAQPGIWERTRRDLVECIVTIIVSDAIVIGLGGFLSRPLGREMWAVGFGVAGWVTICFATVIAADLLFGTAVTRRTSRRGRNAT
jgi:hypothetical protein